MVASDEKWSMLARALRRDDAREPRVHDSRTGRMESVGTRKARQPSLDEILRLRGKRDLTRDDGTASTAAFARIRGRMALRLGLSGAELRGESWLSDGAELAMSPAFIERRAALAPSATCARSAARSSTSRPTKKTGERLSDKEFIKLLKESRRYTYAERHEAAHAVVAHALGMRVDGAAVGDGPEGETRISRDALSPKFIEDWLTVLYAGHRGERSHTAWDARFEPLFEREGDFRQIEEQIAEMELWPKDEAALRSRVIATADAILARNSDALDGLTDALIRRRSVYGSDLEHLLAGVR